MIRFGPARDDPNETLECASCGAPIETIHRAHWYGDDAELHCVDCRGIEATDEHVEEDHHDA